MQQIHILTMSSNIYAKQTAVMLTSLLENKNPDTDIVLYTIDGNISYENKVKLNKSIERFNLQINFLPIDPSIFDGFKLTLGFSKETYFRIMASELVDSNLHKLIILDSDIIVKNDLTKLWNTNIDNYFLGAVEDLAAGPRQIDLSMPLHSAYFNAGVLLLNLDKWRYYNIPKKVMKFIKKNPSKILWVDQDGLNAILYDNWLKLDLMWNYQTVNIGTSQTNPAIIHFTGFDKPWNTGHPLQAEYFKYESITEWIE